MSRVGQTFATADEAFDDSVSIGDGLLRMNQHGGGDAGFYWMGSYVDKRGLVTVYRQKGYTRLDIVAGGRMLMRSWQVQYGDRTITRLARAFLTEHCGEPA